MEILCVMYIGIGGYIRVINFLRVNRCLRLIMCIGNCWMSKGVGIMKGIIWRVFGFVCMMWPIELVIFWVVVIMLMKRWSWL